MLLLGIRYTDNTSTGHNLLTDYTVFTECYCNTVTVLFKNYSLWFEGYVWIS